MKKAAETSRKKALGSQTSQPQITSRLPSNPVKKIVDTNSSSPERLASSNSQRKTSTPTRDKPTRADSPNVSNILPTEKSNSDPSKKYRAKTVGASKRVSMAVSKSTAVSDTEKLSELLDFEYARYLQILFAKKLTEDKLLEENDQLMGLQKRIADNQNILEKTITRFKNINFNKEVETLHKLRNPNYGRVLENLDNANCKEYLEEINKKMEHNENRLTVKNIELPDGGASELLQIMKDTLADCEKLKANNNLEVPKVLAEIKASNSSTSEQLSRCLEMVPEVENLIVDKATLEIYAKDME